MLMYTARLSLRSGYFPTSGPSREEGDAVSVESPVAVENAS